MSTLRRDGEAFAGQFGTKTCLGCKIDKPVSEFYRQANSNGWASSCKKCYNKACWKRQKQKPYKERPAYKWRTKSEENAAIHRLQIRRSIKKGRRELTRSNIAMRLGIAVKLMPDSLYEARKALTLLWREINNQHPQKT